MKKLRGMRPTNPDNRMKRDLMPWNQQFPSSSFLTPRLPGITELSNFLVAFLIPAS